MVAYSFNARFELPIVTLRKTGTIRNVGKRRHAKPGETLQLYTGMRTRACRLLATAVCSSQDRLRIWFEQPRVIIGGPTKGPHDRYRLILPPRRQPDDVGEAL